uniref:Rho termination factor-like N-terminal domain-containing protein n=1 Tax=viral metagenome TaxID=1070528 RepID=A0A6C0KVA5_9ZZZZ
MAKPDMNYDNLGYGNGNQPSNEEREAEEEAKEKAYQNALLTNGRDQSYGGFSGGTKTRKNYDKCTVAELKSKASDKKIKGYSKMTKQELINVLRGKR